MSGCNSPGLLPVEQALVQQLDKILPVQETESVTPDQATGRITAEDIISPMNVPPSDNSAMDGYALKASDAGSTIQIVAAVMAGQAYVNSLQQGEAVRIMTGAPVPQGADAVVMQEEAKVTDDKLVCLKTITAGENIRKAGEDIQRDSVILPKGTRLAPQHLSLLASVGMRDIQVYRKIKVAIMATGDELIEPGKALQPGQIYESNRVGLTAMLRKLGAEVTDFGIIPDQLEATRKAFAEAAAHNDWVISSGGVSVGDADFVKPVLQELGDITFWKIAIKPGKPYAFGRIQKTLFSGLPGNPVSSFVTLLQLVVPGLRKLAGEVNHNSLEITGHLDKDLKRRPGRAEFLRARMWLDGDQNVRVMPGNKQGSGIMNSFTDANCFVVIDADCSQLAKNAKVKILPFDPLLN
ncbi:molybdopterin molybdotransferase MoeA [Planctobacterium marinum]|uniref:molybdopterin molybdotransferase MoeA n=1 Tax=Planctobacterium marinum TaxID=1631968 RepID=UPI001E29C928|nr:gephyrin-like molybdotransferase Glp [Planctobacterium marinum]MCC2603869.1 molybdopterin molybdotransferase MoeA [Planctobacterium marinum]